MNLGQLMGLFGPTILVVFSLTFLLVWSRNKAMKHVLAISAAFGLGAVGVVFAQFIIPPGSLLNILLPMPLTLFATSLLVWAVCQRAEYPTPYAMLGFIGFSGTLLACWATLAFPTLNLQSFMLNFTFAGLFATGAYCAWFSKVPDGVGRLLFWAFTATAVQMTLVPFSTLSSATALTGETFHSSNYWLVLNFVLVLSTLGIAITLLVGCAADVVDKVKQEAELDLLTDLKTRRAFEEGASQMFAKRNRTPLPCSFVICDIDHFKQVNDTFGHQSGDRVITSFGSLINSVVRQSDLAGRLGGEEFGVLLWNADLSGGQLCAEALRSAFSQQRVDGFPLDQQFTASFGVATALPEDTFADLYRRADAALYIAKRNGRNRVEADLSGSPSRQVA